jgi:hypothetical protein
MEMIASADRLAALAPYTYLSVQFGFRFKNFWFSSFEGWKQRE